MNLEALDELKELEPKELEPKELEPKELKLKDLLDVKACGDLE